MYTHYNHCHRATAHLQLNILLLLSSSSSVLLKQPLSFCSQTKSRLSLHTSKDYLTILQSTVIYLDNNTTYIGNQYQKFGDMFRFNRTIIRPNTRHSIGTFSEWAHCGIPYCLQL